MPFDSPFPQLASIQAAQNPMRAFNESAELMQNFSRLALLKQQQQRQAQAQQFEQQFNMAQLQWEKFNDQAELVQKASDQMLKAETPEGVAAVATLYQGVLPPQKIMSMQGAALGYAKSKEQEHMRDLGYIQAPPPTMSPGLTVPPDVRALGTIPGMPPQIAALGNLRDIPPQPIPPTGQTQRFGQNWVPMPSEQMPLLQQAQLKDIQAQAAQREAIAASGGSRAGSQPGEEIYKIASFVTTNTRTPEEARSFLEENYPHILQQFTDIAAGKQRVSRFGAKGNVLMAGVSSVFPGVDQTIVDQRAAFRHNWGNPGSDFRKNITSLNTVAQHLDTLDGTIESLKVSKQPLENWFTITARQLTGDPTVTAKDATQLAVTLELHRALSGVGITDQERQGWLSTLRTRAFGYDQAKQFVATAKHLVDQRLGIQQSTIEQIMGKESDLSAYLPGTKEILTKGALPSFATESEAMEAAKAGKIKKGDKVRVADVLGTWH